jgi:DNA-binding NarL/FixJ family response regulator
MGVGIEKSWMWMKYIETINKLTTITYKNMTYEATHIKTKWQKKEMAIEYKKEGLSDREIAIQLDIDNHTVAAYLKNVSLKQELPSDNPEAD